MTNLSKKIVKKIKSERIKPASRWKFLAKRSLIWCGFALAMLLGALSLGIITLSLLELDENIFSINSNRLLSFPLLRSIPLLWLGGLILSLGFAVFGFRNTRHGYRYRLVFVAGILILFVMVGATILHFFGWNKTADQSFRRTFPGYERFVENRERFWSQPEEGFLAGEIAETHDSGFSLTALDGNKWDIIITKETIVRPAVTLKSREKVKVIGDKIGENTFKAEDIRPWEHPGNRQPKNQRMNLREHDENFSNEMRFRE